MKEESRLGWSNVQPLRRHIDLEDAPGVSLLVWGSKPPEAVFLHGRGQNAHTWDSVIRFLELPALAFDLPGHGHSEWREDHDYGPWPNADAVAEALGSLARKVPLLVGMSLGGLTGLRIAAKYPDSVERLVIVDAIPPLAAGRLAVTPEQRGAAVLLDGPSVFETFDEMLDAASRAVPQRPRESLERGVRRNARKRDDGRWTWRYDPLNPHGGSTPSDRRLLWSDLDSMRSPAMLVRSARSGRVSDDAVRELLKHHPETRVETVQDSGHSIQSDQPAYLADLLRNFHLGEPRIGSQGLGDGN